MTLYDGTRDLHHACEQHPVGQRMVGGSVTPQEWADWLWAMRVLHLVVDASVPAHMVRDAAFTADLSALPAPHPSKAALSLARDLVGQDCGGAAYVLHGAHRSGGRVIAPKMAKRGLPTAHVCYPHPDEAQAWLAVARGRSEWSAQAQATFAWLLDVMDEIEKRREQ